MTSLMRKFENIRCFGREVWLAFAIWSGPEISRAVDARIRNVDIVLTMFAAALPWSTTAASILGILAFISILPTIRLEPFQAVLMQRASTLPLALVLLAAIGTTWAGQAAWLDRVSAFEKLAKLLLLPLLLYHFQFSRRLRWIFAAFVGSNLILLVYSFAAAALPMLAITQRFGQSGVPVKNYIDQSQGFAFIAIVLAALAFEAISWRKRNLAISFGAASSAFFANLIFINVARTAFFYLPLMLMLLMLRYLNRSQVAAALLGMIFVGFGLWSASPNLQGKVSAIFTETSAFEPDAPIGEKPAERPSAAMRLEFWRKSLGFFETAPVIGHGTGSIRQLFERDAMGRTGLSALVVDNPHNQTLAAAVQWGVVGVILLWSMWVSHVHLFRGTELVAWVGLLATLQNMASSVFNSHLTDFYEGWLYVLAVGMAGGALLSDQRHKSDPLETDTSLTSASGRISRPHAWVGG